jgi:transcription antitermination factor NusG
LEKPKNREEDSMSNLKDPHWLAAYTKSRNEKKVYDRIIDEGYEAYLPLQRRLKQWSDRKKWVEEPLLRSYVFVRITQKDYYKVLSINGLIRFVSFEGKPVPIPAKQIDVLKMLLGQQLEIETVEVNIEPGDVVDIQIGSMTGFSGELVRHQGKSKVVIQIDHVSHKLLVTLPANYVVKSLKG